MTAINLAPIKADSLPSLGEVRRPQLVQDVMTHNLLHDGILFLASVLVLGLNDEQATYEETVVAAHELAEDFLSITTRINEERQRRAIEDEARQLEISEDIAADQEASDDIDTLD